MTHIEDSIIINKPIDEVFKYASDYQHWHEWFEGVSEFTPTTGLSRGNGTRYAYKAKIMGMWAKVETEIQDFVPNQGWNGKSTRGLPHKTHWIFTSADGKTKFTYGLEYKLPIPLLGPILDSLMIKPQWIKIINHSLNNLRQRIE
jgi:coenzyme Q-binding protein COQ10